MYQAEFYILDGCKHERTAPGTVLTTSDYIQHYDTFSECTWTVHSPELGTFSKVLVDKFYMAPGETPWQVCILHNSIFHPL